MIQEILEQSKRENKFIGIWTYDDNDGFWSGKVRDFNDTFVFIDHYTKYGKLDGSIVEQIDNIQSIDFNDDYSEFMEYLVNNHQKLDEQGEVKLPLPKTDNWPFEILRQFEGDDQIIVRIQLDDDITYTGLVDKCDEEATILNCINSDGLDEHLSLYKNADIKMIRVNDIEARKRLLLFNWRKTK